MIAEDKVVLFDEVKKITLRKITEQPLNLLFSNESKKSLREAEIIFKNIKKCNVSLFMISLCLGPDFE